MPSVERTRRRRPPGAVWCIDRAADKYNVSSTLPAEVCPHLPRQSCQPHRCRRHRCSRAAAPRGGVAVPFWPRRRRRHRTHHCDQDSFASAQEENENARQRQAASQKPEKPGTRDAPFTAFGARAKATGKPSTETATVLAQSAGPPDAERAPLTAPSARAAPTGVPIAATVLAPHRERASHLYEGARAVRGRLRRLKALA